jgi:hypothetical protein
MAVLNAAPLACIGLNLDPRNTANTGAFAVASPGATLLVGHKLVAALQGYSPAPLPPISLVLPTNSPAYVISAVSVTLTKVSNGSVSNPGPLPQFSLVLTGVSGAKSIVGNTGVYTIAASAVTMTKARGIAAVTGTYATAFPPSQSDFVIDGDLATYAVSGTANLVHAYTLPTSGGAYVLTGLPAGLVYQTPGNKVLSGAPGIYLWTGNAANPFFFRGIVANTGAFICTGLDAGYQTTGHFTQPVGTGTWRQQFWGGWYLEPRKGRTPRESDREQERAQEVIAEAVAEAVADAAPDDVEHLEGIARAALERERVGVGIIDRVKFADYLRMEQKYQRDVALAAARQAQKLIEPMRNRRNAEAAMMLIMMDA